MGFIWLWFWHCKSFKVLPGNCIRNNFLSLEQLCIYKFIALLLTYFRYGIKKSMHLLTIYDACSDLYQWILQEWTDWEQFSNYSGIIFPKQSIVCWNMLVVMDVFHSRFALNIPQLCVLWYLIYSVTHGLHNSIHTYLSCC